MSKQKGKVKRHLLDELEAGGSGLCNSKKSRLNATNIFERNPENLGDAGLPGKKSINYSTLDKNQARQKALKTKAKSMRCNAVNKNQNRSRQTSQTRSKSLKVTPIIQTRGMKAKHITLNRVINNQ